MKRVRTFLLLSLVLFGCQTPPKIEQSKAPPVRASNNFDYEGLKKHLGLNRPRTQLGFTEAAFDTCTQGFNLPQNSECRTNYVVVVNFRLQCRHSTGTISQTLTNDDIQPVANATVKWNLKNMSGTTATDTNGYGFFETISDIPQNSQRLRLAVGDQFLYIRAADINRVVTPAAWCD